MIVQTTPSEDAKGTFEVEKATCASRKSYL